MLQLPDLDNLIGDACIIGCRNVLREVFLHLKSRSFNISEILTAISELLDEEGCQKEARILEDLATSLLPNPYPNQQNDGIENII